MSNISDYNRQYYIQNREKLLKRRILYYHQNKEVIKEKHRIYYSEYYQNNKKEIITRVKNNYLAKIHAIKEYKPPTIIPIKTNQILDSNIIIKLMD